MKQSTFAIFLIALCAYSTGANAQNGSQTWRCGNSYSDQPCKGGKSVDVADPRTEADRRAADAATRRAEVRADSLAHDRMKQEAMAAERERRAAALGRREARAERKTVAAERLATARARRLQETPRGSTRTFRGRSA